VSGLIKYLRVSLPIPDTKRVVFAIILKYDVGGCLYCIDKTRQSDVHRKSEGRVGLPPATILTVQIRFDPDSDASLRTEPWRSTDTIYTCRFGVLVGPRDLLTLSLDLAEPLRWLYCDLTVITDTSLWHHRITVSLQSTGTRTASHSEFRLSDIDLVFGIVALTLDISRSYYNLPTSDVDLSLCTGYHYYLPAHKRQ
jgi:hypothetical protein